MDPSTTTIRWSDPRRPLATRHDPAGVVVPVFTPSYPSVSSSLLVFSQVTGRFAPSGPATSQACRRVRTYPASVRSSIARAASAARSRALDTLSRLSPFGSA